jgi:hypothetical protein
MTSTIQDRFNIVPEEGIKHPCRMATTVNITLSGLQTIDGVSGAENDRVLVVIQTDASENGIYVMQPTAWVRASDWDDNSDVVTGMLVTSSEGTVNNNATWQANFSGSFNVGTTPVSFPQRPIAANSDKRYGVKFTNIAAMEALNPVGIDGIVVDLQPGMVVDTVGAVNAGVGPGRYRVTAPQATDGFFNRDAANGNALILEHHGSVGITQAGAIGSGDEATIIQGAINAAAGLTLILMAGMTFASSVEPLVSSALTIRGKGTLAPIASRALHVEATASGTKLKDFLVQNDIADVTTNTTSILINGANDCLLERIRIADSFKTNDAIKIKDGDRNEVIRCRGKDLRGAFVLIEGTLVGRGVDNLVHGCTVDGTGYHGIYTRKHVNTKDTNNRLTNNTIRNIGEHTSVSLVVGIEAWGHSDVITGNTLKGVLDVNKPKANSFIGITVGTNPFSIVSNNRIDMFVQYGVEIGNNSHGANANNNVISNIYDDFAAPTKGAAIAYTGTVSSIDCIFSCNNSTRTFIGYDAPFGATVTLLGNTLVSDLFDRASHATRGMNIQGASTFSELTGNTLVGWDIGIFPAESSLTDDIITVTGGQIRDCNWGVRSLLKPISLNGVAFHNCGIAPTSAAVGLESGSKWSLNGCIFGHDTAAQIAVVVKNEATDHGGKAIGTVFLDSNVSLTGSITSWVALSVKDDQFLNGPRITYGTGIPGSGTYTIGHRIINLTPSVLGGGGSQYTIENWKRITTGPGNVLNTDWVEGRELTGT